MPDIGNGGFCPLRHERCDGGGCSNSCGVVFLSNQGVGVCVETTLYTLVANTRKKSAKSPVYRLVLTKEKFAGRGLFVSQIDWFLAGCSSAEPDPNFTTIRIALQVPRRKGFPRNQNPADSRWHRRRFVQCPLQSLPFEFLQ